MTDSWGDLRADVRHTDQELDQDDEPWSDTPGFEDECTLCGEWSETCHNHHTSYEPERTRVVCSECHYRIHNEEGYFDRLDPTGQKRDNVGRLIASWGSWKEYRG